MPGQYFGTLGRRKNPYSDAIAAIGEIPEKRAKMRQYQEELKLRKQMARSEEEKAKVERMATTAKTFEMAQDMINNFNQREPDKQKRQQYAGIVMKRIFGNEEQANDTADMFKEFAEYMSELEPQKPPEGFVNVPGKGLMKDPTYRTQSQQLTDQIMSQAAGQMGLNVSPQARQQALTGQQPGTVQQMGQPSQPSQQQFDIEMQAGPFKLKPRPTAEQREQALQEEEDRTRRLTRAKEEEKKDIKLEDLRENLEPYFDQVDILEQYAGEGLAGRLLSGGRASVEALGQDTPLGLAASEIMTQNKRLRVILVRAAGDVGNINIVEQKAAEQLLITPWMSKKKIALRKAYLQDIARAKKEGNSSLYKETVKKFMNDKNAGYEGQSYSEMKELEKLGKLKKTRDFVVGNKTYYIPLNKVGDFLERYGDQAQEVE